MVTKYQQMIAGAMKGDQKPNQKKLMKFPFSQYKEKMKAVDRYNSHVSMDGETGKVTVKFLK